MGPNVGAVVYYNQWPNLLGNIAQFRLVGLICNDNVNPVGGEQSAGGAAVDSGDVRSVEVLLPHVG